MTREELIAAGWKQFADKSQYPPSGLWFHPEAYDGKLFSFDEAMTAEHMRHKGHETA